MFVTANGASEQELEAIRLAIEKLWPDLVEGPASNDSVDDEMLWRFSGRPWNYDLDQWGHSLPTPFV